MCCRAYVFLFRHCSQCTFTLLGFKTSKTTNSEHWHNLSFLCINKLLLVIPQSVTLSHTSLSCLIAVCIIAVPKDLDKDRGPFVKPTREGCIILLGADTPLLVITSWAVTKWLPGNTAVKNTLQGSWRAQVRWNNRSVWDTSSCIEQPVLFMFLLFDYTAQPWLRVYGIIPLALSKGLELIFQTGAHKSPWCSGVEECTGHLTQVRTVTAECISAPFLSCVMGCISQLK